MVGKSRRYTLERLRLSVFVVKLPHRFCIGMYITFVRGLYAPAGQFLPPWAPGQIIFVSPSRENVASGLTVTTPVAPSMPLMTFCMMVGRAHRNSPVARSSV